MSRHRLSRRTRLRLTEVARPKKAVASPVIEEDLHQYQVELTIDGGDLAFVATLDAPHPDAAVKQAGVRLQEIIADGHFITHFHVSRVDDESEFPAQRRGVRP